MGKFILHLNRTDLILEKIFDKVGQLIITVVLLTMVSFYLLDVFQIFQFGLSNFELILLSFSTGAAIGSLIILALAIMSLVIAVLLRKLEVNKLNKINSLRLG